MSRESWLVLQGVRGGKDQREVRLILLMDGERGDFNVIDAESEEEAAQKFLYDTDADACLVFPLPIGRPFLRQVKAVAP